jgi:outer membrane immunogenic protein
MKKFAFAVSIIAIGTVNAFAADLPVKAPPLMPVAVYDWTGFYFGANAGYAWNATSHNITYFSPVTGFAGTSGGLSDSGGFGGAQVGYNRQFDHIVLGIEADLQGSGARGSFNVTVPSNGGPLGVIASQTLDYFGTLRGRVGVAFDRTLVYATGGFAYGGVRNSFGLTNGGATALLTGGGSTQTGYTAGGGVEYAFSPNWSVKGEYQYIDLGGIASSGISTNGVPLFTTNVDSKFHTVRIGINYKIGAPAVVAKY